MDAHELDLPDHDTFIAAVYANSAEHDCTAAVREFAPAAGAAAGADDWKSGGKALLNTVHTMRAALFEKMASNASEMEKMACSAALMHVNVVFDECLVLMGTNAVVEDLDVVIPAMRDECVTVAEHDERAT